MNIIYKILKYLKEHRKLIKNISTITLVVVVISLFISSQHYKGRYESSAEVARTALMRSEALKNQNSELSKQLREDRQKLHQYEELIDTLESQLRKKESEVKELTVKLANEQDYPDEEYVQSTYLWNHLKSLGLNDYVCAGILGNIMAEVGGQTLDISLYSTKHVNGYYGICQWAHGRKERLLNDFGESLEAQCEFLSVELFEIIPQGSSFYDLQDEQEAALYFAMHYERCHSSSYSVRQENATKALTHFTDNYR